MSGRTIVRMMTAAAVLLGAGRARLAGNAQTDPKTWEFEGQGKWSAVKDPATQPVDAKGRPRPSMVDNPTLDRAERAIARRDYQGGRKTVVEWLRRNRDAPDRDRGLFLLAKAHFGRGDRIRAYYHLDELMDYFPESTLYGPALEMQFQIAEDYLRGRKDRLFGLLRVLPRRDEAVEMLFRIQERSPGSPQAERAPLRTADFYYESAQFDLAQDAYAIYARNYPRSPSVVDGRVPLRAAYASLAQFRGLDFDATPLIDARAQLEDVQNKYPQTAKRQNVTEVIERIDAALAAKLLRRADFFKRTEQTRAAADTYRSLMEQYPSSPEAGQAQQALARLPREVNEQAPRPGAPPDVTPRVGPDVPGPDAR